MLTAKLSAKIIQSNLKTRVVLPLKLISHYISPNLKTWRAEMKIKRKNIAHFSSSKFPFVEVAITIK